LVKANRHAEIDGVLELDGVGPQRQCKRHRRAISLLRDAVSTLRLGGDAVSQMQAVAPWPMVVACAMPHSIHAATAAS
jgi:hypothetical protein